MTGLDFCQLIRNKWRYAYDVQLRRVQGKVFLQVMWKYLEQMSFPLTETEYLEHLDEVVSHLQAMGALHQVIDYIEQTRDRPRLGKAISIPLQVNLGARSSEWLLDD